MNDLLRGESLESQWKMLSDPVIKSNMDAFVAGRGSGLYSTATRATDAAKRLGEAKARNFGDPILHSPRQEFIDNVLRPISGVVKDINPRIYKRLVDMEGRILNKTHEYHQLLHPFYKQIRTFKSTASAPDYRRFSSALLNGKAQDAKNIWLQYGMDAVAYDDMRFALGRLEKEMSLAGVKFNKIDDYFPRLVKDHDGLRRAMGLKEKDQGLDRFITQQRSKLGHLTPEQEIDLINKYMGGGVDKKTLKTIKSTKKRALQTIEDDILDFYYDPKESLEFHLREALSKIERNKFYGKPNIRETEEGLEDIAKSVGAMIKAEGVTGANVNRLKEVLLSRFTMGERMGRQTINSMRQLTGGVTLGNPVSAVRQFGDVPSVMKTQGITNTLVGLLTRRHPDLNADTAGYMLEMAQELDLRGAGAKARWLSHKLYKYGGFRSMDRFTKNTFMQAALRKTMSSVNTPKKKTAFVMKYADIYEPAELQKLIKDIEAGVISDGVKSHINAEIMRIQPISRSQMPKYYLDHPNLRMFWQFRTWGLNQMELFRQDIYRGLKSNVPSERRKAARDMVLWTAGIGTTNQAITEFQRWITGREGANTEELPSEIIWQTLGNFGLDRYAMSQAAEKGEADEYLQSLIPPSLTIPGTVGLQILQAINGEGTVPENMHDAIKETGFGRLIDFTLLGGAERYNEKLQQRRKEKIMEPVREAKKNAGLAR
jgi:hypothetical protein